MWQVNTQCPADQAEEAMKSAWDAQPQEVSEEDKAQFDIASTAAVAFLDGQTGWWAIGASGNAIPEGDEINRGHFSLNVTPTQTPYGIEETTPPSHGKGPGKPA